MLNYINICINPTHRLNYFIMSPNGFTYQSTLQLLYTIVSNTPEIFPVLLVIALFVHFSWYAKTKKKSVGFVFQTAPTLHSFCTSLYCCLRCLDLSLAFMDIAMMRQIVLKRWDLIPLSFGLYTGQKPTISRLTLV